MKYMKEFLYGMNKSIENEAQLRELTEKCKYEDDPLLRAMKKELSNRIFGSTSNSVKKEDLDDVSAFRNSASPLATEERFPSFGSMPNNFNLPKENDVETCQWFSILPKESCDSQTLLLGKNLVGKKLK